jgi:hypothetical protein
MTQNIIDDYFFIDTQEELKIILSDIKKRNLIAHKNCMLFIETEFINTPANFIPVIYEFIYELSKDPINDRLRDIAIVYYLETIGNKQLPFNINRDADLLNSIYFWKRDVYKAYIHKFYNYYSQIAKTDENAKMIKYTLDSLARWGAGRASHGSSHSRRPHNP